MAANPRAEMIRPQVGPANKQRHQLLAALSLLLLALAVILVKDREFWFGSDEALEADSASESVAQADPSSVPAKTGQTPVARAANTKNHLASKTFTEPAVTEPSHTNAASPDSPVVVASRAVLPPLVIEVVAGDKQRTLHPASSVQEVEIPSNSNRASAVTTSMVSLPTNAAAHERLSTESVPELRQTVDSTYPPLGQHMRVQGSVVLQAVVGADGTIQDLRVVSGPAILAGAAQQAVRQWRFKPYLQNGQPVETLARITVNFSIRVQENS